MLRDCTYSDSVQEKKSFWIARLYLSVLGAILELYIVCDSYLQISVIKKSYVVSTLSSLF